MKEIMLVSQPAPKLFICEICQEAAVNPLTMGIESDRKGSALVQLCPECGAVDLELMQFCREAIISCSVN